MGILEIQKTVDRASVDGIGLETTLKRSVAETLL